MKKAHIAVLALFGIAGNAVAQAGPCGGFNGVKTAADIQTLLAGKYACVHNQSNELHSGGTLIDFKKGPSDPVNPSEQVGTYTITAGTAASYDRITYNYGTGGTFAYAIKPKPGTAAGTCTRKQRMVCSAISAEPACVGHPLPEMTMFGFRSVPSRSTPCTISS